MQEREACAYEHATTQQLADALGHDAKLTVLCGCGPLRLQVQAVCGLRIQALILSSRPTHARAHRTHTPTLTLFSPPLTPSTNHATRPQSRAGGCGPTCQTCAPRGCHSSYKPG